jgi:hypothetical protein
MEVSDKLHVPAALPSEQDASSATGQQAEYSRSYN